MRGACAVVVAFVLALFTAHAARADVIPQPAPLPQLLTLDEAVRIFRAKSLDLLIAEAAVVSAEGDVSVAGASPNPALSLAYGRVLGYNPNTPGCDGCSADSFGIGLSDSAAIEDSLAGKRTLRLRVAEAALKAAKLQRADAQRTLEAQVKTAYVTVVQAQLAYDLAVETQVSWGGTLEFVKSNLASGKTDRGAVARVETQKLEADQSVDSAVQTLRQARIALAFLLGVRGRVPDFDVEKDILKFTIPTPLAGASEDSLVRLGFDHRPDLRSLGYQRARAEAAIALARRLRFPDITFSVNYTQTGTGQNAIQPPFLSFGLSAPLPVLYQQQGEIKKAEADYDTQSLSHAKAVAQVVNDVGTAYAGFMGARRLIERMETSLLQAATTARDVTRDQYRLSKIALIDLLDSERTYVSTRLEQIQDLTNYWTAVFSLEQAVGVELRK